MNKEIENEKEDLGVEPEDTLSQKSILMPYDVSRINVIHQEMPVLQVMLKIKKGEINLQPDFQRNIVWDAGRQSRLIESILIRIPLPSFYLDAINDDEWLVVDGLQRLATLDKFVNKNELRLSGLEFLGKGVIGKTFTELPRSFQRRIEDNPLFLYIIRPETPVDTKLTIFRRINTGGLVLNAQEIRHCLFKGKSTELLKDLSSAKEFLEATTKSISPTRMDDRECILRFCVFHLTDYKEYRKPDFDIFLGEGMQRINKMADKEMVRLRSSFLESMAKSKDVFGSYAFRKMYERDGKRNPINKSLFEAWSVSLQRYDLNLLKRNKEQIIDNFIKVMNNKAEFLESITQGTGDVKKVHLRFSTIESIIKESIKC